VLERREGDGEEMMNGGWWRGGRVVERR